MMRVLIADDEPLALDKLERALAQIDDVELVGSASNGQDALVMARSLDPDLLLLDIQMPGASGLDVAASLQKSSTEVVFVTAFSDCATKAFDLDAVDYLLKPVSQDRLAEAIVRARRRQDQRRGSGETGPDLAQSAPSSGPGVVQEFWVRQRNGFRRVPVNDIQRIEADRDYALLHTADRTYIMRIRMNDLERCLDPAELVRVHRSMFVRPSLVIEVESHRKTSLKLHMVDGAIVEVGASYAQCALEALGIVRG